MPGPFFGIGIASNALRSFQRALDITGHNIANVNTPGYSRQVVDFGTQDLQGFWSNGRQWMGSGVGITSVNRIRDMFLDARMREGQADLGRYQMLAGSLKQIEGVFNEPSDNGISSALNKFFDAWSGLASNPNDPGAKLQVKLAGETLAGRVRSTYGELNRMSDQITGQIGATVDEINGLATEIQTLNDEIRQAAVQGGPPNDLLDRRDAAIERLSGLANVNTRTFEDGTVAVYVGQHTLVEPASPPNPLPTTFDASTGRLGTPPNHVDITGGRLRGLLDASFKIEGSATVPGLKNQLDNLANTLRTEVNGLHKTIADPLDTTERFFNDSTPPAGQTGAIDFDLTGAIKSDPSKIIAGIGGPGDGSIALKLSGLRDARLPALGNKTIQGFYRDGIADLGRESRLYTDRLTTRQAVVGQIDSQRQSVMGVSLDDEMANMLRFQRSYQAAAKVLTIFDQVTEDLIGMLRR